MTGKLNDKMLKWLRKQRQVISIYLTLDCLYLLDELVEQGEYKNRSKAIEAAIDMLLQEYCQIDSDTKLSDFYKNLTESIGEIEGDA